MTQPKRRRAQSAPADDPRWADLADLVLVIAREIQFRGYADQRAVALSQSEGMVMRYLVDVPAAPPSRIAAASGLQRTNLSTVLRGLEAKGLIERRASPEDGRGVMVMATEHGVRNYALVRREWGSAASSAAAAGDGEGDLDAALRLLRSVEDGLVGARNQPPGARPAR